MTALIWPGLSLMIGIGGTAAVWPFLPPELLPVAFWVMMVWFFYRLVLSTKSVMAYWTWRRPSVQGIDGPLYEARGILLGYGFRMTAKHTQQLLLEVRRAGALPLDGSALGGSPALHAVGGLRIKELRVPWPELVGHIGIFGGTRVGKTRLLELMVSSMIQSPERGPIIVIDPKGDAGLYRRLEYEAHRQGRPFYSVRAADVAGSHRLNPMETALTASEVAARIEVMFPGAGRNAVPIFTDYPVSLVEAVASAHQALGRWWSLAKLAPPLLQFDLLCQLTAQYVYKLYGIETRTRREFREASATIGHLLSEDSTLLTLTTVMNSGPVQSAKLLNALTPALRGLHTPPFGPLFAGQHPTMTWSEVESSGGVAYVGLNNLLYRSRADSMSRLVLSDVAGYVAQRYTRSAVPDLPITLVIDELGAAAYPDFVDVLAQAGGANLRVIVSMQSEADLVKPLGGQDGVTRLTSNLNTIAYLRLSDDRTAQTVSEGFGHVRVEMPQRSGSVTHGGEHGAMIRVDGRPLIEQTPLIRPEWLQGLPKGNAYVRMQGQPYKVQVPLLPDLRTPEEVADESRLLVERGEPECGPDVSSGNGPTDASSTIDATSDRNPQPVG